MHWNTYLINSMNEWLHVRSEIDLANLETAELIKWIKNIYSLLGLCKINSRPKNLPHSPFIHSEALLSALCWTLKGRWGYIFVVVNLYFWALWCSKVFILFYFVNLSANGVKVCAKIPFMCDCESLFDLNVKKLNCSSCIFLSRKKEEVWKYLLLLHFFNYLAT